MLVNAGGDTVRNLVGGGILTLFAHPEAKARFENDLDGLMPLAVEEFVRYQSPVVFQRRTAMQDSRLRDVEIKQGDKLLLCGPNPHLGFAFVSERFNVKDATTLCGAAAAVSERIGIAIAHASRPRRCRRILMRLA